MNTDVRRSCEDLPFLPFPLAHVGDKKVNHFSEIIGRLPYMRATRDRSSAFDYFKPKVSYRNPQEHSSFAYHGDPVAQSATSLIFAAENVLGEKTQTSASQVARLCDLETLVERFGSFFVSDRRDAIYALLPLSSDAYFSTEWIPDYKRSVEEVYKDFIMYSIQRTGSLDILVRPWAPEKRGWRLQRQRRLPSWIACYWGPTSVTGDGGGRIRELVVPLVGTANKRNYTASGSSRVVLGPGIKFLGNTLRAHGIWLDTIAELHGSLGSSALGERFRTVLDTADKTYQSLETMYSIKTGRSYFLASTGIIGLAPNITEEGDLICILFGCSVPVILRKEENDYILIGESYVDGFMHGEAMKGFENGTFPLQEFCLI
jgi:hypothetical protein